MDRYVEGAIVLPVRRCPGETENTQARVALYKTSVLVGRDYFPLGAGLGRYGSWLSREHYSPLYVAYDLSDIRGLACPTGRGREEGQGRGAIGHRHLLARHPG